MKKSYLFLLMTIMGFFIGCNYSVRDYWSDDDEDTMDEDTLIAEETGLFELDEANNNIRVFETNSSEFLSPSGYTIWAYEDGLVDFSKDSIDISIAKFSGDSGAGYGVVFCCTEIDGKKFMMSVLINSKGKFCIGRIDDGVFSYIRPWGAALGVVIGLGQKNRFSLTYNENKKTYSLLINEHENAVFNVPYDIDFENCQSGYVVVISNREKFPKTPVKVVFEK